MTTDSEKRIDMLIKDLDTSEESIRLKMLQKIAKSSNVNHLKTILPFSKYKSKLTEMAAANAARQILCRAELGALSLSSCPQETIKELLSKLDAEYESWRESDLAGGDVIRGFIKAPDGMEDNKPIDDSDGKAGMVPAMPVKDVSGGNLPGDTSAAGPDDPIAAELSLRFSGHESNETMMMIKSAVYKFLLSKAAPVNKTDSPEQ